MPVDLDKLTRKELAQLWPQAVGELTGFATALELNNAQITAEQIRLAIQMAERYYRLMGVENNHDSLV